MSDLLQSIQSNIGPAALEQLASQLGVDKSKASEAVGAALPLLLGQLTNNAKSGGAADLAGALERDHDGGILNDVQGFFGSGNTGMGAAILGHVLGGKQKQAESTIGGATGLSQGQVGSLLAMLAPIVLGQLGKKKREQGLDAGGLIDILRREEPALKKQAEQTGIGGMLGGLLDKDGDGDFKDELASEGLKVLGGLFGRKK